MGLALLPARAPAALLRRTAPCRTTPSPSQREQSSTPHALEDAAWSAYGNSSTGRRTQSPYLRSYLPDGWGDPPRGGRLNRLARFGELFDPPRLCVGVFGGREIEEEQLRRDARLAGSRREPAIATAGEQFSSGERVGEIRVQNLVAKTMRERAILEGHDDLHAAIEIPRHQVRAADEHLLRAAIAEVPRAAVLQEPSDDAAHPNAVADAGDAWSQRGNAPDDEIHLNAGLGRAVKKIDSGCVDERVHLQDDVRGFPSCRPAHLTFDERSQAAA